MLWGVSTSLAEWWTTITFQRPGLTPPGGISSRSFSPTDGGLRTTSGSARRGTGAGRILCGVGCSVLSSGSGSGRAEILLGFAQPLSVTMSRLALNAIRCIGHTSLLFAEPATATGSLVNISHAVGSSSLDPSHGPPRAVTIHLACGAWRFASGGVRGTAKLRQRTGRAGCPRRRRSLDCSFCLYAVSHVVQ